MFLRWPGVSKYAPSSLLPPPQGLLPGRQTYVISKDGKLVLSFNSAFDFEAHVMEALKAVKA